MKDLQDNRLVELLADQSFFGLSAEEGMELGQLKKRFPEWENDFSLELTAAAIGLANLDVREDLPANLRAQVYANADEFFSEGATDQEVFNFAPSANKTIVSPPGASVAETTSGFSFWQNLGWAFAAVAGIALAVNIWTTRFEKPSEVVKNPETIQMPKPELTTAQKRDELLASAKDAVQISLTNPKNEKEIVGDMVWSNEKQRGYARFRGLPANDAAKETYQVWIVDETQDSKTPISGGVFDVDGSGEIIVPINAQLAVKKPKAVAITKEKVGGVVVSKQENVVAIAKV
ncbi:MAG: anti-sigma factor [Pyrinomonadaceae bacterium]|nr:anti-sigma factor [Pyrinomonadaceae bacterium]